MKNKIRALLAFCCCLITLSTHTLELTNNEIASKQLEKALENNDLRADVNKANNYGETPLMLACDSGNEKIIKLLLKNRALPDQKKEWKQRNDRALSRCYPPSSFHVKPRPGRA